MPDSPLDGYLATVDPRFAPLVRALADAVEAAGPRLVSWVSYGMLMFGHAAHRRDWVCAVGTSSKAVHLRFLHGDLLEDRAGLLRAGRSTLRTLDVANADEVDLAVVAAYVREAVATDAAGTSDR